MADNGDVSKRLEAARLMREAAKLLEDSESGNKKETTSSATAQLQKLFAPYSAEGKNPCQSVQLPKPAKRQRTGRWTPMFNPSLHGPTVFVFWPIKMLLLLQQSMKKKS